MVLSLSKTYTIVMNVYLTIPARMICHKGVPFALRKVLLRKCGVNCTGYHSCNGRLDLVDSSNAKATNFQDCISDERLQDGRRKLGLVLSYNCNKCQVHTSTNRTSVRFWYHCLIHLRLYYSSRDLLYYHYCRTSCSIICNHFH